MHASRRQFFKTLPAAAGFYSGARFPLHAADRPKKDMIVRSARPLDLEMPLDGFSTWITPVERFFVRSHMYMPKVDRSTWRLKIEGEVENPLTLSLDDLKKFPRAEVVSVLECAGNGRSFYEPGIIGMQWTHGAVGNGRWAGVRLGDLLKKAGMKASAKEVLFNGADVPIGTMPDFVRTAPVRKALDPDTLLAYEMNGEPLPEAHGFPLRAVVPGWAGDSWVKWLTNIEVRDKEFDGFFMKTAYRYPVRPVAPGAAVDPANLAPLEAIRPKSVIASPEAGAGVGQGVPVTIQGAAWAGSAPVARVEVSADSGRTWQAARLGSERAKYAWRLFEHTWTPPGPGSYVLMSRTTDARGGTQPFAQDWNPSGYQWNVVHQVRVEVGNVALAPPAPPNPPRPEYPEKVRTACIGCHESDIIEGQRLTRGQWDREVTKMTGWGAKVAPADRDELLDFLSRHFGTRR